MKSREICKPFDKENINIKIHKKADDDIFVAGNSTLDPKTYNKMLKVWLHVHTYLERMNYEK